jgi:hypothetical protein
MKHDKTLGLMQKQIHIFREPLMALELKGDLNEIYKFSVYFGVGH